MSGEVKSIRRQSFLDSYGIKEVEEDEESSVNDEIDGRRGHRQRFSLTIDDIEDIDITDRQGNMDISLLGSFADNVDIDTSQAASPPTTSSQSNDSETPPPNFAGGANRRRGDKQRRARQRFGVREVDSSMRRASTGTVQSSIQESFGEMSLQSFTSINSFTSTSGASGNLEVGNLVFVTDDEMAKIMYGDDNDANKTEEKAMNSPGHRPGFVSQSSNVSASSNASNLSSSLPPSAMLGTGAFSTVRLAWRKTPEDLSTKQNLFKKAPRTSLQEVDHDDTERDSLRSIVRIHSEDNNSLEHKGELVAVKIIQKSILKQMKSIQKGPDNKMTVHTAFDNIEREIATMKRLRHPNLVRLFEVIDSVESDRLHMVLEYVSLGEILSHVEGTNKYTRKRYRKKVRGLTKAGHFDEEHSAMYFVDIMHGLAYLHRNRICHRDLKPENILLCANGIAKISDFGVSHIFEDEDARQSYMIAALDDDSVDDLILECQDIDDNMRSDTEQNGNPTYLSDRESDLALGMSSKCDKGILKKTEGTWCFWSPEMCSIESQGFSGYASDLWAAGVCLYIFATGTLPFFSLLPSDLFELIAKAEVEYEGLGLSKELNDLLGRLLKKEPSARAGVGDCLKHEFCANARTERINALGNKFEDSEDHIILSGLDVEMALSVSMPKPKKHTQKKISKRFSAPAVSVNRRDFRPAAATPTPLVSDARGKNDSNLTTLTEASVEVKADHSPDSNGSNAKKSKKKIGLASKFKLNKLWRRHN